MSIQPNRVIHRIVDQVDKSDWPRLSCRVFSSADGNELLRVYLAADRERYATPLHFWIHALRDELTATGRRLDLVGAAGHAMGQSQSVDEWRAEIRPFLGGQTERFECPESVGRALAVHDGATPVEPSRAYRMLESECRKSSVFESRAVMLAHFWGHGATPSWRVECVC